MLDIHAHILPGVDDGAKTHRQALLMLSAARAAGIDVLVATPHLRHLKGDISRFTEAFRWLQPYAQEAGICLLKGYEIWYKALLDIPFLELDRYCIIGTRILLLELDSIILFPLWNQVLGNLTREGYELVIVHPERYAYIQEHPEIVRMMRGFGCKIQISAQMLLKPPWNKERGTAQMLMRKGWVDYIASDAHCPQDYRDMKTVLHRLHGHLPRECISMESIFSLTPSLSTNATKDRPVRFV